jgi:hypothetical protein
MKTTLNLRLQCAGVGVRRALSSVLAPDNEGAPRGLEISMVGEGRVLQFSVRSETPSTVISTVVALLRDVALFQEVWLLSRRGEARVSRSKEN